LEALRCENEPSRAAASHGVLEYGFVRKLIELCHPGGHDGFDLAQRVTVKLLAMKGVAD
jgi:hypothetical protein